MQGDLFGSEKPTEADWAAIKLRTGRGRVWYLTKTATIREQLTAKPIDNLFRACISVDEVLALKRSKLNDAALDQAIEDLVEIKSVFNDAMLFEIEKK